MFTQFPYVCAHTRVVKFIPTQLPNILKMREGQQTHYFLMVKIDVYSLIL
jgi:hypothetical protein